VDFQGLDKVSRRDGHVSTRKSFVVEHGKSGLATRDILSSTTARRSSAPWRDFGLPYAQVAVAKLPINHDRSPG